MDTSTSIASARRNLAQRIDRFLVTKQESVLTAGEATNITAALASLESGRYPDGEDAMMLAEKDWPPRGEVGKATTVEVLAGRLAELGRAG
jgi:hypothetical protein